MKILWLTWKDGGHPHAGGAETVNEELAARLVRDGHEVLFLVGGFPGGADEETRDGYRIVRLGGRYSVYWHAYRYYKKNLEGWADLVIEEVNTIPFFARSYVKERHVLFFHQLCREIWFYQMAFPMNAVGYLLEPLYLRLLRGSRAITVSESSKRDLVRNGFRAEDIDIISQGIRPEPMSDLDEGKKADRPTILSLGTMREMKRTKHQIRAFEIAKRSVPDLQMKIAGDASYRYGKETLRMIERSPYKSDIEYLGHVTEERKIALMRESHAILVTSVKEGWGLIVTEANSQGTPAVVYDIDGLRDSVRDGETGISARKNDPAGLAEGIVRLLGNPSEYDRLRRNAWEWSRELTFDRSYEAFRSDMTRDIQKRERKI